MMNKIIFRICLVVSVVFLPSAVFAQDEAVINVISTEETSSDLPVHPASADPIQHDIAPDIVESPAVDQPEISSEPQATSVNDPMPDMASTENSTNVDTATEAVKTAKNWSDPPVDLAGMTSIFFSKWEHSLLIESRLGLKARPVVPGDAGAGVDILLLPTEDPTAPILSPREVSLSGIAYVTDNDWVIWLNGARLTPVAIPANVMDLRVFKNHIDIEWLDRTTNQIYPIRLRTHQKFNLDTRMFLPAGG